MLKMNDDFMKPFATNEDFIEVFDPTCQETHYVPAELRDIFEGDDFEIAEEYINGRSWFSRLSAPGYTDATDWQGPYHTEEMALWSLYICYGDDEDETFANFLGEGHKIVKGSLRLTGSRNELYGRVAGEMQWDEPREQHLATMGDVDLDEETGEFFDYDPNDDPDLGEAYGFELVEGKDLAEQVERIKTAQRDSKEFRQVETIICWHSVMHTTGDSGNWNTRTEHVPAEISDDEAEEMALNATKKYVLELGAGPEVALMALRSIGQETWTWDWDLPTK